MREYVNALVVALVVVIAGGLLMIAVSKVREAAGRMQCSNNLKQIGFALHNYHSTYSTFPMATMPHPTLPPERRLSWAVSLVPYLAADDLYHRTDKEKGWEAPENRFLGLLRHRTFRCPVYPDRPPDTTMVPATYVGLAGLGADAATLPLEDPRAGFFGYERKLTLAGIKRGTDDLLAAVETAEARGAWTAGGPSTVRGVEDGGPDCLAGRAPLSRRHGGGCNALLADGSVRYLGASTDPRVLEAMATLRDPAPPPE